MATAGAPPTPSRGQGPREIKKSGPLAQPETQTEPRASQNYSDHQQRACHTTARSKSPTHSKTPSHTPGAEQTLLPQTAVASSSLCGAFDRGIRRFLLHYPTKQRCMLRTCEGASYTTQPHAAGPVMWITWDPSAKNPFGLQPSTGGIWWEWVIRTLVEHRVIQYIQTEVPVLFTLYQHSLNASCPIKTLDWKLLVDNNILISIFKYDWECSNKLKYFCTSVLVMVLLSSPYGSKRNH